MTEPSGPTLEDRQAMQRADIAKYTMAAETAVAAVNNMATNAQVSAAESAIAAARMKIADAADVPAAEKAANTGTVNAIASRLTAAKEARTAYINKMQSDADKAMMATASKLHAGISAPGGTGADQRTAAYGGENDSQIVVMNGETSITLSEDKKAMVHANHGWTGAKYTADTSKTAADDGTGTYEAVVFSNIGDPEQGKKFGKIADSAPDGYEYGLNSDGELAINTDEATNQARVASPSFDQSAGTKTFTRGANLQKIMISGSYHGVSGTYSCAPTGSGDAANQCTATVAAKGFTLGGGTWTFKPGNAEARVMSTPDANYASYGWWLHKDTDGDLTASAFKDNKGTEPTALAISALRGTATYMGGAAGKYALYSTTGGTNDAGHFTARAMLTATFAEDHKISGTIDNFMGADGEMRQWSVELKEAAISDEGVITRTAANDTAWTINGSAASASGEWSGNLHEAGKDGVPAVGIGTFYTTYGNDGKMVGGFGVTKQ